MNRAAGLVAALLLLAAGVLLVTGLRAAAAGERDAVRGGEVELQSRLRGEAVLAADALRGAIDRTRAGSFADLPFAVSVVQADFEPRPAMASFAAPSAALERAEQLEFVEHDVAGALEEYRSVADRAVLPDDRARCLRNAARLTVALAAGRDDEARDAARPEALALLGSARELHGVGDREALLAAYDAARLVGAEKAQRLVADLEHGRYDSVSPAERLVLHAQLGGEPARRAGLAALAAVLDSGVPDAVARVGDDRLAWRLRDLPPRSELAVASLPAVLSALLPGCAAGDWELLPAGPEARAAADTRAAEAARAESSFATGVLLPRPFPDLALHPTPRALARVTADAAAGERWPRIAVVSVACALLGAAVLWLLDARRRAELDRRKDAFVCSVTHELRTPIANILLFAETLRDHGRRDPDRVEHFAGVIGAEAGLLRARVDEVLDVATGRRAVATHGEMAPSRVLHEIAEEARGRLAEAGMTMELSIADERGRVRGSEDLLRRAVAGLVDNAGKHAGRGTLRLSLRRERGALVLDVEDDGPGVPVAERERIFEPFVRLGDEMTRTVPGTGLGLTLVRQCVELCGGRVAVLSREGGGACFRITLPELAAARREVGLAGNSERADDSVPASDAGHARGDGHADHPAG